MEVQASVAANPRSRQILRQPLPPGVESGAAAAAEFMNSVLSGYQTKRDELVRMLEYQE